MPKSPKVKSQVQDTLVPPCNIHATDVKAVYDITDSILSKLNFIKVYNASTSIYYPIL